MRSILKVALKKIKPRVAHVRSILYIFQFDYASRGRGARSLSVHLVIGNELTVTPVWIFNAFGAAKPWSVAIAEFQAPASRAYRLVIQAKFLMKDALIAIDNILLEHEDGRNLSISINDQTRKN